MNPIPSKVLCKEVKKTYIAKNLSIIKACAQPHHILFCKNTTTKNEDHKHNSTSMQRSPNGKEEKEKKIIPQNHNDNH
jgi:hypothetical protein